VPSIFSDPISMSSPIPSSTSLPPRFPSNILPI
jgi:hypothetical protein